MTKKYIYHSNDRKDCKIINVEDLAHWEYLGWRDKPTNFEDGETAETFSLDITTQQRPDEEAFEVTDEIIAFMNDIEEKKTSQRMLRKFAIDGIGLPMQIKKKSVMIKEIRDHLIKLTEK